MEGRRLSRQRHCSKGVKSCQGLYIAVTLTIYSADDSSSRSLNLTRGIQISDVLRLDLCDMRVFCHHMTDDK